MKKRSDILILVIGVGLLALIVGATLLYGELSASYAPDSLVTLPAGDTAAPSPTTTTPTETQPGETTAEPNKFYAPDFTVYDGEGNAVHLSDFLGKPVVINFWASWCPPCKAEMPDFEAAYKERGEDVVFMMVNMTDGYQETLDSAKSHVAQNGYTFPVYFDTDQSAAITYSATSLPTTYFIHSDGSVAAYGVGMLDAATLERGLDMLR